jgi:hypothetical protein
MANRAPKPELKKPTKGKAAAAADDSEHAEEVVSDFDDEKFVAHVKNIRSLKTKAASIRGEIGAAVKAGEEDYGIHRGAASLWIKLDGMEEEARIAFLKAFDDMRTALGYAHQGELFNSDAERATFAGRGAVT